VSTPETDSTALPSSRIDFVHNSQEQLARLFDFSGIRWEYEPHTFVLSVYDRGVTTEAFTPDFWLPDHGTYIEVTTMRQGLVTRKNRKVRRLRDLHPELTIRIVYQRDYLHLLVRFGLESPSQLEVVDVAATATEAGPSLLTEPSRRRLHPSMPEFTVMRRAG
jgi:hypothetical protein